MVILVRITAMKFVPTQTERTVFLWLVLVFMAMLVSQCWWTSRWDGNAMVCKMWMLTFASLLIMISLMTGTKRQIFGWLVSMSSLLIAYWFSPTPKLYGPAQYWHHLGDDITGCNRSRVELMQR